MFDNEEEPYQLENRIADKEYKSVREYLHKLVKEWQIKYNDSFVLKKQRVVKGKKSCPDMSVPQLLHSCSSHS